MATPRSRTLSQRRLASPHTQGDARIHQPIGSGDMSEFMPFLLLDDLETVGTAKGFGDHPHRGQETMTYILQGGLLHQDNRGNAGILHSGDMQVMRAGRGIVHNEEPIEDPVANGTKGIQLWVALPEGNLRDDPWYKDIASKTVPISTPSAGVTVKILTGESFGVKAPVLTRAPVWYLDITLDEAGKVSHPIPANFNAFAHVLEGNPTIGGQDGVPHETFFFKQDGEAVDLENRGQGLARVLLIAGDPLEGQQVHRMGPFVAASRQGITQAMFDYRQGINGFEGVHTWSSRPRREFTVK